MKQNNDVITFEVNETLYFENGQEIDEMLSISLDPEIAIQTYENYIQVRGLILLQGEYIKVEEKPSGNTSVFDDDLTGYIEKVIDTEDNQAAFSHRFPVEISVPPYRVENLEDVTVNIDSFDYELPDPGKLKIKSSVHINGIKADTSISRKEDNVRNSVDDVREQLREERKEVEEVETEKGKVEEQQVTEKVEEIIEDKEDVMIEEIEEEVAQIEENEKKSVDIKVKEKNEIDIQLNESEAEEDGEEVKDVRFLTELFGGDEEESYTKMRIYITQEDDTIESIAKRYEVSALQLLKDNNLSGESIEEGLLLHLPIKSDK